MITTTNHTRALSVLLVTVVVNMIGVGLAWPVLPKLVQQMGNASISQASAIYAIIGVIFALSQFIFAPIIGALSDRFGRRPLIIICLVGLGIDYALTAFVSSLFWLGVVRFIGGVFAATITTANAYAADISTPENRARNFGFVGAAFGVGFILGPILGGFLGAIDIRYPFIAASILTFTNVIFAFLALPESLNTKGRRKFELDDISAVHALKRLTQFKMLTALLLSLFITATAQRGLETTWVLYTDFRFGWGIREAAWSLAFVGVMYFLVQGLLVGPVVKLLGEWRTVRLGFGISCVSLCLYGLAYQGWMVYPLIMLYVFGNGISGPALNAICSKSVEADRQGQVQGALQSINSLAVIIGPFAASYVLAIVSAQPPIINIAGLWFIMSAAGFIIALVMTNRAYKHLS